MTGSSRRREGREGELQGPNMSRRVFFSTVLLLIMFVCCGSGGAFAERANAVQALDPFTGTTVVSSANWEEIKSTDGTVSSLRVPSIVKVGGELFAVAFAHVKGVNGAGSSFAVASKSLGVSDGGLTGISTVDVSSFGTELLKGVATDTNKATGMVRPTTIVIGDSVYMLLGNYRNTSSSTQSSGENGWGLLLVKGSVTAVGGVKKIQWNETHAVTPAPNSFFCSLTELVAGGGSGVVMQDGTLAFPLQATDKNGKSVVLSMRLTKSKQQWELPSDATGKGCRNPSLVKWEEEGEERLFVMASCDAGYYDVYMSTLSGTDWYSMGEEINRVWGTSHDRKGNGVQSGFTTAIIEETKVMLITTPVYPGNKNGNEKGQLHLWVTDRARVYDVGSISDENDDAAGSSLLYNGEKKELISLYEKKNGDDSYSLLAVRLTEQLERVKGVVNMWKALDNALETCSSSSEIGLSKRRGMCSGPVPTKGLVGFLSNTLNEATWKDEYLGVNATVKSGVIGTEKGVTFQGVGAGAEWPVGKLGQTVPYYFANNKFTLVVTVTIHEVPETSSSPVPLMGAKLNDDTNTVLFQLSYTHEKNWSLAVDGHSSVEPGVGGEWQPNTTFQLVVQLDRDDYLYVCVDGKRIYGIMDEDVEEELSVVKFGSNRISHFYFGAGSADAKESGHVTVSNVFLYNRLLLDDEIQTLGATRAPIPEPAPKEPVPQLERPAGESVEVLPPEASPLGKGDGARTEDSSTNGSGGNGASGDGAQSPEVAPMQDGTKNEEQTEKPKPGNTANFGIDGLNFNEEHDDSTVRGWVSRVLPILLLGLWGMTALC